MRFTKRGVTLFGLVVLATLLGLHTEFFVPKQALQETNTLSTVTISPTLNPHDITLTENQAASALHLVGESVQESVEQSTVEDAHIASGGVVHPVRLEATPSTQDPIESDQALVTAYQSGALAYEQRLSQISSGEVVKIAQDGDWSYAQVAYTTPQNGTFDAMMLGHRVNGNWIVIPPHPDQAQEYNALLTDIPEELLLQQTKEFLFIPVNLAPQASPLSNYKLPWYSNALIEWVGNDGVGDSQYPGGTHGMQLDVDIFEGANVDANGYVVAARSGKVVFAKDVSDVQSSDKADSSYANMIILEHQVPGGFEYSWYVHLAKDSIPAYLKQFDNMKGEKGPEVAAGAILGQEGATGYTFSGGDVHLHFMVGSRTGTPADFTKRSQQAPEQSYWYSTKPDVDLTLHEVNFDGHSWNTLVPGLPLENTAYLQAFDVSALLTAIDAANSNADTTTIVLTPNSTYTLTTINNSTYGPTGLPMITTPITIVGNGATITRPNIEPKFRIFAILDNASLTLDNLTIQNGSVPMTGTQFNLDQVGGGVLNLGNITIRNSIFEGNSTDRIGSGGGIYSSRSLAIFNSTFEMNTAGAGGAIFCSTELQHQNVVIENSSFRNNQNDPTAAFPRGGAIHTNCGLLNVDSSNFEGNQSKSGGAIHSHDDLVITNSTFINNKAFNYGGAVYDGSFRGTIQNSVFTDNDAGIGGGALYTANYYNNLATTDITNSRFRYNTAAKWGGAIYNRRNMNLVDSLVQENIAGGDDSQVSGGGIASVIGKLTIIHSSIVDNEVFSPSGHIYGGNVFSDSSIQAVLNDNCIVGRSAQGVFNANFNSSNPEMDATNNWWGASDGPSSTGSGSGGAVGQHITFSPFLTSAVAGCPGNDNPVDAESLTPATPQTASLELATNYDAEPISTCEANVNRSLWYKLTSDAGNTLRILINQVNWRAILSVWTGEPGNLDEVGCRSSNAPSGMLMFATAAPYLDVPIEPNTTYYIMVASDDDEASEFTLMASLAGLPPEVPTLLSPAHQSTVANTTPTFTWTPLTGATSYEIQIGTVNPGNSSPIRVSKPSYKSANPLLIGTYFWRVRALNTNDVASAWSEPFIVTIESPANAAPMLNYVTDETVTLNWSPITWADHYEVEVSSNSQFSGTAIFSTIVDMTVLSVEVPNLPRGTYYWRVRAIQDDIEGRWSSVEAFSVGVP